MCLSNRWLEGATRIYPPSQREICRFYRGNLTQLEDVEMIGSIFSPLIFLGHIRVPCIGFVEFNIFQLWYVANTNNIKYKTELWKDSIFFPVIICIESIVHIYTFTIRPCIENCWHICPFERMICNVIALPIWHLSFCHFQALNVASLYIILFS